MICVAAMPPLVITCSDGLPLLWGSTRDEMAIVAFSSAAGFRPMFHSLEVDASDTDGLPENSKSLIFRKKQLMIDGSQPLVFSGDQSAPFGVQGSSNTGAPFAVSIGLPGPGIYGSQDELKFVVRFSEKVKVVGEESLAGLPVEIDALMRQAKYVRGSGSKQLVYELIPGDLDLDLNGIKLGAVDEITGLRDCNFSKYIEDMDGNFASDEMPFVDTASIRIDARGPSVIGYTNPSQKQGKVSIKVEFDRPVIVHGKPVVPIILGDSETMLSYKKGSGSKFLLFQARRPDGGPDRVAEFDPQMGQVILLQSESDIKDKKGNSIDVIGANMGEDLVEEGSKVVLLGSHYEFLESVSAGELNTWMDDAASFYLDSAKINQNLPATPENIKPYLLDFEIPSHPDSVYGVDIYRVAYRTSIPDLDRAITNYGILAMPKTEAEAVPLVSWESQTTFNKNFATSQAFSYPEGSIEAAGTISGRLKVASYASQGMAVICADQIGLGNSRERYAYLTKPANQQAGYDLYLSAAQFLQDNHREISDLFVAGWSSGGLTAAGLVQKFEQEGVAVDGLAIAAGSLDLMMNVSASLWNPRDGLDGNTPDAKWLNYVLALSAFSLARFSGEEGVAEDMLGKYYEASRRLYASQYTEIKPSEDGSGIVVDGLYLPNNTRELLADRYRNNQAAYAASDYARLLTESSSHRSVIAADMLMVYGEQDEVVPVKVAKSLFESPQIIFGKQNIESSLAVNANHRGTFLKMISLSLPWFKNRITGS